tara:strand:- start:204 stop:596 length:393 start_codon:yes stop_codon:yes gene_type:complete
MSRIIESRIKELKFIDETLNNKENGPFFQLFIKVIEKEYKNSDRYFYINYNYNFIKSSENPISINFDSYIRAHPFKNDLELAEGCVIPKNESTSEIINILFMNDDEITKINSQTSIQKYRIQLMASLSMH